MLEYTLNSISRCYYNTFKCNIMKIPGISGNSIDSHATTSSSLAMTNFGIPLTGSMSAIGFIIRFIK
jgi:hypothetical protein